MKPIPDNIQKPYTDFLKRQKIAPKEIPSYLKWQKFIGLSPPKAIEFINFNGASLELLKNYLLP